YRLGDTQFTHELEKFALNSNPGVRANTAMAIGMMGNHSGLKVLRVMANDSSSIVRLQVAASRWLLGDEGGLTDLVSGTISRYPDDQIVCILGIAAPRDPRVIEHVRDGLVSPFPEVSLAAARAAGELGSDEGYGIAMIGAKSQDARQRALAALAFGAIGRTDAQPILAKLLTDDDPDVRISAATAILELK
ncbi:MAG TPA: HEAT repeat domain-containing protein, partial [Tepidisphaeraceae bacterium]|nr:HEAT repeat domain-containing protein [Tepidisphaeraceae bacterium]